ncbi:Fibrinogen- domains (FReDs) [Branchiostoma belcheri]|nr:Fibrinogen- domains (FReDs) [Branchiostoma belcheri]
MSGEEKNPKTGDTGDIYEDLSYEEAPLVKRRSGWCKKFWLTGGGLVFVIMAVVLPFVAVNLQIISQEVMKNSARLTELERTDFNGTMGPVAPALPGPPGELGPAGPPGERGPPGYPGQCTCLFPAAPNALPADCAAVKAAGHTTSGVYTLGSPLSGVKVYCDMDTAGGGWTVIQRRMDGSVPFSRTWVEYKRGFGNKNGEYWLGNENIHLLTNHKAQRLRVDMMDWEMKTAFAEYDTFRVSNESDQYRLSVSGYSGDAHDCMANKSSEYSNNNGMKFSTKDRDNDICDGHCSQFHGHGGWWYRFCSTSFLNSRYLGNCGYSCEEWKGVVWELWRNNTYSLKSVSMKIRPR